MVFSRDAVDLGAGHLTLEGGGWVISDQQDFFFEQPGGQEIFFPPKPSARYFFFSPHFSAGFFFPQKSVVFTFTGCGYIYIVVIAVIVLI